VAAYNGTSRQNRFDIQVSTDNVNWTNVLIGANTSGTSTAEENFDVADTPGRWVRYLGHGSSDPTKPTMNSVTEFSVFATTSVITPTPTPAPTETPTPTPTSMLTPTPTPTPFSPYMEVTPPASGVTASTNDGNVPGNVVDNNLGTRWSANGDGQWLQLDLGNLYNLARVNIAVYNGNARQNNFEIQVMNNAGAWVTVKSGPSSGTTTAEESYDFPITVGRFVRYLGHMNTVNGFNSVTEVSVFSVP
jgi:hypothetical protein